eukprot:3301874-Rhodomonas_salina.2
MTQLQRAPCPHKTAGSHLAKGPREALATLGALVPAAVDNSQGVSSDAALVHRHRKNRREALLPQRRRATKHGGRRESGGECKEERANCREQSYTRHHSSGLERTWPPVRFQEGLLYHSHALVLTEARLLFQFKLVCHCQCFGPQTSTLQEQLLSGSEGRPSPARRLARCSNKHHGPHHSTLGRCMALEDWPALLADVFFLPSFSSRPADDTAAAQQGLDYDGYGLVWV